MQKVLNLPEIRAKQKESVKQYQIERWKKPEEHEKLSKKKSFIIDSIIISMVCNSFINNGRPFRDKLLKILSNHWDVITRRKRRIKC
jgi:DNA mismatch repair ATPase MutL